MLKRFILRGAIWSLSLIFLFALASEAQITIHTALVHRLDALRGQETTIVVPLINGPKWDAEITTFLLDYGFENMEMMFYEPGFVERSASSFFVQPNHRFHLPKNQKAELGFKVKIPHDLGPGSYYTTLTIRTAAFETEEEKKARVGLKVVTEFVLQYIFTVPGIVDFEIEGTRIDLEAKKFFVTVKNTGEEFTRIGIRFDDEIFKMERKGIFPGKNRTFEYDLSDVPFQQFEERVLLDNGDDKVKIETIEFIWEEEIDLLPLTYLDGKSLERKTRRGKFATASIRLFWGSARRGLRIIGGINLAKNLRLNANSNFYQPSLMMGIDDQEFAEVFQQGYRIGMRWSPKHFNVGISKYIFNEREITSANVGLNFKYTNLNASYIYEYQILSTNFSQKLGPIRFNFYGNFDVTPSLSLRHFEVSTSIRIF